MAVNRKVLLTSRPKGIAQAENFAIISRADPAPEAGELRVQNLFLSVEPAMRGWIADPGNYAEPVPVGSVMRALCVGRVLESKTPEYAVGDLLFGWFGWQEEAVVASDAVIRKVPDNGLSPSLALGVLGINGVTAHVGMSAIGQPGPNDTVVVSTAAGSVGSAAGQIARIMGAGTVGIAGGPDKVRQCVETFGYDAAIDYRVDGLAAALDAACPNGINVYFDNVAGQISDTVYPRLAIGARVVVCGTASIPQWDPWPVGPRIERHLLTKRARMQGFVIFDHMDKWDSAVDQLSGWIREGKLHYAEDMLDGIDACPDAIAGLYRGENMGKRIIRIAD
ncbi:MAG: NADP-dependent oxidoreductase [Novosphingobium sp.]|nr:NADP-dependent oxidoreductase [Novosphingobium sp.]